MSNKVWKDGRLLKRTKPPKNWLLPILKKFVWCHCSRNGMLNNQRCRPVQRGVKGQKQKQRTNILHFTKASARYRNILSEEEDKGLKFFCNKAKHYRPHEVWQCYTGLLIRIMQLWQVWTRFSDRIFETTQKRNTKSKSSQILQASFLAGKSFSLALDSILL